MLEPEAERIESDPYPDYPEPEYEPEFDVEVELEDDYLDEEDYA